MQQQQKKNTQQFQSRQKHPAVKIWQFTEQFAKQSNNGEATQLEKTKQ